jgi:hypothetical protein
MNSKKPEGPYVEGRATRIKTIIRYLKPEYLEEISESCEIEET